MCKAAQQNASSRACPNIFADQTILIVRKPALIHSKWKMCPKIWIGPFAHSNWHAAALISSIPRYTEYECVNCVIQCSGNAKAHTNTLTRKRNARLASQDSNVVCACDTMIVFCNHDRYDVSERVCACAYRSTGFCTYSACNANFLTLTDS